MIFIKLIISKHIGPPLIEDQGIISKQKNASPKRVIVKSEPVRKG